MLNLIPAPHKPTRQEECNIKSLGHYARALFGTLFSISNTFLDVLEIQIYSFFWSQM